MPLRPPRYPPTDSASWDRWARDTPVEPDPNSVGDGQIQDLAVSEPKLANLAVSTRTVIAKAITDAKLRDSNALSVIGRSANTNGSPADIAAATANTFLARRGTQLVFDPLLDADIPSTIARDTEVTSAANAAQAAAEATAAAALSAHAGAADPHTGYQKESEKDSASGYAGLNASIRTTKGVDTTDDLIVDDATNGLVLKDTQGTPHYWRVTVSNAGALVITDAGTTKP